MPLPEPPAAVTAGPSSASPSVILPGTWVARTAPSTETPDGAAQGAEERDRGRGRADVADVDGVLHGQHEVLHHRAHAEAHQRHGDADVPHRGGVVDRAEPGQARRRGRAPPPTRNPFQRPVRLMIWPPTVEETSRPRHQRDGQQAGLGRAVAAGDLEVLAEEGGATEHRDADGALATMTRTGGAVRQDPERDHRLRGPRSTTRVRTSEDDGRRRGTRRSGQRPPREVVAREGDPQQRQAGGDGDEDAPR